MTLMDISKSIGGMPKAKAGAASIEEQSGQNVVGLISEIVANADIVGHQTDGCTVYLLHLSPASADTLAALFADLEDGDPLDVGEDEHDGREPDPEDVG